MKKISDRWALAARKEAIIIKPGRTLRLLYDETVDDPINPTTTQYLVTRAIRHELARRCTVHYKLAKRRHMKENMYAPCYICGKRMTGWLKRHSGLRGLEPTDVTIDHIIPLWLVLLLELPSLEFDRRNFALAHGICNTRRGVELCTVGDIRKEIGDKVLDRLFEKAGKSFPDNYHHHKGLLK